MPTGILLAAGMASTLGGCGGGLEEGTASPGSASGSGAAATGAAGATTGSAGSSGATPPAGAGTAPSYTTPANRMEATRFLMQAAFGARETDIDRVMALGYGGWIDEQFNSAATPQVRLMTYVRGVDPGMAGTSVWTFLEAFYQNAVAGNTPLRDRLAFELSKIFVISSLYFLEGGHTADYYDMLAAKGTTSFRELLEAITLHPTMGNYLSMVGNQPDNAAGRIPDQNYAREIMQLFSIGLYRLNADGTLQTDGSGAPIPTYTQDDVVGLSRVFTGYSYGGGTLDDGRFFGWSGGADKMYVPMAFYPRFHSTVEKRFLGVTIPAPGGAGDLAIALDALASHPNVAPNMARQLIQRFVTSNPSAAYVRRVAGVFATTNGDMKSVVKAVLLDAEARDPATAARTDFGKVREPLLRMLTLLRGFGATSDSGKFRMLLTDDVSTALGQTPLRAPSVFNFYRPGYTPPLTRVAAQSLVAPEMQMLHEVSVVGFPNMLEFCLSAGFGFYQGPRPDIRLPFNDNATAAEFAASEFRALADTPASLVARIDQKLFYGQMGSALTRLIVTAVSTISVPAPAFYDNSASIDYARKQRVKAAIYLAMVSPRFLVQR